MTVIEFNHRRCAAVGTEIARRVEALFALADQIEAWFQKAHAQVDKLTPSLLARVFHGQLPHALHSRRRLW